MKNPITQKSLQLHFLDIICRRFEKHSDAVNALAAALEVNQNAIYRRLRGDTVLAPEEMKRLALQFDISLDALIRDDKTYVPFNYFPFIKPIRSFEDYLSNLRDDLVAISRLPDVQIYYASAEIPIFYYAYFPELMAFKLYVWGLTVWKLDYLQERKFGPNLLNPYEELLIREILQVYRQIPSLELWSLNLFDNTLNQIEYFAYLNRFAEPAFPGQLCRDAGSLVEHLRSIARSGRKSQLSDTETGADFTLYHNEMIFTNNTVYVKNPIKDIVFSSYCNPNFISTDDPRMTSHCFSWYRDIIDKSTLISQTSGKHRDRFFDSLARKTQAAAQRIEHLNSEYFV